MQEHILVVRVVFQAGEKVLLLRRSPIVKWSAGKYELPGGKVSLDNESLPAAVQREVAEETGLMLSRDPKVFHVVTEEWEGRQYIVSAYHLGMSKEPAIQLSDEHDAYEWIELSKIQQLAVTSHTLEIIAKLQELRATGEINSTPDQTVDKIAAHDELIIYTDGGSRGNPGPSASGFVIMDKDQTVLEEGGAYLGITTNNQAEYQAVKLALEQAVKYRPRVVTFRIDSELVVRQMNGQYQIKNRDLWPVHANIKALMQSCGDVQFVHVFREHNTLADGKVNEILDSHKHQQG